MTVEIRPLNLAEILGNVEAVKSSRAQREHQQYQMDRERRLSDILANTDINKPEGVQAIMRVNPELGIRLQGQQQEQQHNRFADSQAHIKLVGQLASGAMQQLQQLPKDQWSQALPALQQQIIQGATEVDPEFGQHLEKNKDQMTLDNIYHRAVAFGGWQDPQAALAQKQAEYQAMTEPAVARAKQIAEAQSQFKQAGQAPRMSLPQGYRMNPETGQAERIPGLPADTGKQAKLPPVSVMKGYQENHAALAKVDRAIKELTARPESFGLTRGIQPEFMLSRTDPEGVKARAVVADLGSLVIHDRSGAAVTAAETPRLRPFIPQVGDSPETIKQKLDNFKAQYEQMQSDIESTYNEDTGYKLPSLKINNATDSIKSAGSPQQIPSGAKIQISPSTGKRRYSTDGGQTWTVVE